MAFSPHNLTNRFVKALEFSFRLHSMQKRKGTNIPYFAHLIGVTSLVLEMGGDEDEAIAALLHDAVEDQGGMQTLNIIREHFGESVANIVAECTDAFSTPKPAWRKRKEQYIAHLQNASLQALRVSLADKLHNARAILLDLYNNGDAVWKKFNGGKEGTIWYYQELAKSFENFPYKQFLQEFKRVVHEIETYA